MERRDIEIFLVLAEELHFGRTAERLHVSQARVSQTIKRIERRIGAPLFERTSRRVALTAIGRGLRDDLAPAVRRIEDGIARATAAARGVSGVLRVAFQAPALAETLTEVRDTFRARHPGCAVRIREAPFDDPFGALGEADLLVTLLPVDEPGLVTGPVVLVEPMVLTVPARHPLAARDHVVLEDLAGETVYRPARPVAPYWSGTDPWTAPSGRVIRRGPDVATFQELLGVVAAGEGVSPLATHAARYFARPSIAFVPFLDGPPARWGLVWRAAAETARVRAFADAARSPARRANGLLGHRPTSA
ncbi:LysR family transcriptional regulator [Actinomadura sp. LOL_016]|uniref:LysR family transcriptional regulator n=1 Tax=unclassified Actinomadura TaxID=2626254 RepID=UPI003A80DBA5